MFLLVGWLFLQLGLASLSVVHSRDLTSKVYFRAILSSGSTIGMGSNVRFNQVDYNIGNAYNPTSGVFTAPVSGLYQFMVHVQSQTPGVTSYSLINEGKPEIVTSIHSAWDSSSYITVIHVDKGNHVSVRKTYANANSKMYFSTQFAGYLLRKD